MTEGQFFYMEKLAEGSRIDKLSNELEEFLTSDISNLQNFFFELFNNCYRFVFENIEPTFSPKLELNLIYQTEQYKKLEKEKTGKTKKRDKWKTNAFHAGNSSKGQIFVNVEEQLLLIKHGFPTFILNFVRTYFHEILHCVYLNLRTEQEIFNIECSHSQRLYQQVLTVMERWLNGSS